MVDIYKSSFKSLCGDRTPIHPETNLGRNVRIGENVIIDEDCVLGNNVFIGHNTVLRNSVYIGDNTIIGHLVVIEQYSIIGAHVTIQSQCHITGGAFILNRCFFGPGVVTSNTRKISHGRNYKAETAGPFFGRGCRIGAASLIMPGVIIGEEVLVGAGSLVDDDLEPFFVYYGRPARKIRPGSEEEYLGRKA